MNGLLLINKPTGISSFDIIRKLRPVLPRGTKLGHAGTLDPLASGLMLILVGSACKQAAQFSKLDKEYLAEVTLGATSATGDAEGMLTPGSKYEPSEQEIAAAITGFKGVITQTPSVYSAIKIGGKEAYKRVRAGEEVDMPSRSVTIYDIELLNYEYPVFKLRAEVSSGTYIRTLAEDIGAKLETGAYLSGLIRSRVGEYSLDDALQLDTVTTLLAQEAMLPTSTAIDKA